MTDQAEPFVPLELFSPSGLSTAALGDRKWAFAYILNMREPKTLWVDIKDEEKPEPKIKSRPTDDEKQAIKAYNKRRRPALGTEVHARLEQYMQGHQVDFSDVPGVIALSGLPHLPVPAKCALVECEAAIELDLSFMGANGANVDPIVFRGTRDLLTLEHDYLLIDHKTTYTFDFIDRDKTIKTVKTPEQLQGDEQANIYGLAVMQKYGLTSLRCRWVYYRTEGDPAAKAVDFVIERADAEAFVIRMVERAKRLRHLMRTVPRTVEAVNRIDCNVTSCDKFGGCPYHPKQGGECTPPQLTMGEKLAQMRNQKKQASTIHAEKKESKRMAGLGFRERAKAREAEEAAKAKGGSVGSAVEIVSVGETVAEESDLIASESDADAELDAVIAEGAALLETPATVEETPAQATARKARGPNKPRAAVTKVAGLGATIAELATQLQANEAEHAEILGLMRAALGAQ